MEVSLCHSPTVWWTHVLIVGRLVHQTNQLAVTSPRKTSPYSAVAPRHTLSGFLFGQSSDFLIHLNEEDAWVLSRGLLLVRAVHRVHPSLR